MVGEGVVEEVDIVETIGPLELQFGAGPVHAEPGHPQIEAAAQRDRLEFRQELLLPADGRLRREPVDPLDERVGPQAGGEHVGVGLREFVPQGVDVEVRLHHPLDGGVDRDPVGAPGIIRPTG